MFHDSETTVSLIRTRGAFYLLVC